jgi:hypothetical protein
MADLENPIMPGAAGGQDNDPEATTAEQDEESTLLHCLSAAFACTLMISVFVLMLRVCRSHPTIMGVRALGVVAYTVVVTGLVFWVCNFVSLIPIFFCGNSDGEPPQDEPPT